MYRMDGHYGSGLGALAEVSMWTDQIKAIAPTAVGGVAGAAAAHYLTGKVFDMVRGDAATVPANSYRAKAAPYVALATPFIGAVATRTLVQADPGTRKKQIRDAAAAGMAIYGTAALIAYFIPADTKSEFALKVRNALPFSVQALSGLGNLPQRWPPGTPDLRVQAYGYPRPSQLASIPPIQTRMLPVNAPVGISAIPPQTASIRRMSLSGVAGGAGGPSF